MNLLTAILMSCLLLLPVTGFTEVTSDTHLIQLPYGGSRSPDEARTADLERAKREAKSKIKAEEELEEKRNTLVYKHKETGLMWARSSWNNRSRNVAGKEMNWNDAIRFIKNLNYGGYNDWRLPTKAELEFFFKNRKQINGDYTEGGNYWTSTPYGNTDNVYVVNVGYKETSPSDKTNKGNIWPVRGGH